MKRVLTVILSLCLLWQGLPGARAAKRPESAASDVKVAAKSVILVERETGTVLYHKAEHAVREPASVTKVMTMLLVAEALDAGALSPDEPVTCSARAASMGGSQVYLKEGEEMSVHDLLKAVAVASGNDAAVALAEHLAGSEEAFVERMNRRARELGMRDTCFRHCNGLPAEGHVTSAFDIALMSRELLKHESVREYVGTWMDTLREGAFQLANTNKLIYSYDGATGIKTGFTDHAGFCISASALRDGMELIAVVLGSQSSGDRFETAKQLLDYGFQRYALADGTAGLTLPELPVRLGTEQSVPLLLEEPGTLLVKKGQSGAVTSELELPEFLPAPVAQGDRVGTLRLSVDGTQVKKVAVLAGKDVPRLTFSGVFEGFWRGMATGQ